MSQVTSYPEIILYEKFKKLYEIHKNSGQEIQEEYEIAEIGRKKFIFSGEASQKFKELTALLQKGYKLTDTGIIGESPLSDNILYCNYVIGLMIRKINKIHNLN